MLVASDEDSGAGLVNRKLLKSCTDCYALGEFDRLVCDGAVI
jgi:hypothetical protein